jgi:hypothetical protein
VAVAAQQLRFCAQDDADVATGRAAGAGRATAPRAIAARATASTPWARAQASRSAWEWQQQLEKHCSAVAQPHGLSMQGKGRDRSLPANGSGSPDATSA